MSKREKKVTFTVGEMLLKLNKMFTPTAIFQHLRLLTIMMVHLLLLGHDTSV